MSTTRSPTTLARMAPKCEPEIFQVVMSSPTAAASPAASADRLASRAGATSALPDIVARALRKPRRE